MHERVADRDGEIELARIGSVWIGRGGERKGRWRWKRTITLRIEEKEEDK